MIRTDLLTSLSTICVVFLKSSWLHDDIVEPVGDLNFNGGPGTRVAQTVALSMLVHTA